MSIAGAYKSVFPAKLPANLEENFFARHTSSFSCFIVPIPSFSLLNPCAINWSQWNFIRRL
jgi:hypothetical protein